MISLTSLVGNRQPAAVFASHALSVACGSDPGDAVLVSQKADLADLNAERCYGYKS